MIFHQVGENPSFSDTNADFALVLHDITQDVCLEINRRFDLNAIPVDGGAVEQANSDKWNSSGFAAAENINGSPTDKDCADPTIETPNLCGVLTGCFQEGSVGQRYIFYHIAYLRP